MKEIDIHKEATSYKICILEDFFWAYLKVSDLKMSFWCLQIFQKNNEIFSRIYAALVKSKKQGHFIPLTPLGS